MLALEALNDRSLRSNEEPNIVPLNAQLSTENGGATVTHPSEEEKRRRATGDKREVVGSK